MSLSCAWAGTAPSAIAPVRARAVREVFFTVYLSFVCVCAATLLLDVNSRGRQVAVSDQRVQGVLNCVAYLFGYGVRVGISVLYRHGQSGVLGIHLNVRALFDLYRSEEHTSELQSRFDLVCRLLLEK